MTNNTKHICADATYKLIQHGYPVLVVGTTDKDKKFHPFGVAMCCNETDDAFKFIFKSIKDCVQEIFQYDYQPTILVAEAITNGFTSVFSELFFRVMCWFHMRKAFTVLLTAQTNQLEDMPKRGRKPTISKALQVDAPIKKSNKRTTTPASSNSKKNKKINIYRELMLFSKI